MEHNRLYQLFLGKNALDRVEEIPEEAMSTTQSLAFRIPSLLSARNEQGEETLIALCDVSQSGGDFGRIQIAQRLSTDGGKTFGDMEIILSLPVSRAPQKGEDFRSAFAIDPILCQCENGDVLMIVDMFPESKAIMYKPWLSKGTGYVKSNNKKYFLLDSKKTKVDSAPVRGKSRAYTVREKGFIYTPEGEKTSYYLPKNHSRDFAYETMGDMYYAKGTGQYTDTCPPLIAQESEENDIYVGNVFLSYGKDSFEIKKPSPKRKRTVSPEKSGDEYSLYPCIEGEPSPLSALVTMRLFVMRSTDCGRTWQQPVDITPEVKKENEIFLGTGPGVATVLRNQQDKSKNSRILVPVYNLKKTFVLYSDDNGLTWIRSGSSHNIDECQLIETAEGKIFSFGRQKKQGKTPVSVSIDGGESWKRLKKTELYAVKCQKSFLSLPSEEEITYPEGMDKNKSYILCSCCSGNYGKSSKRYGGTVVLGEVTGEEIRWLRYRKITTEIPEGRDKGFYAYSSLALLKSGDIGLFYEALPTSYLPLRTFSLQWLWEGEDYRLMKK